MREEAVLDKLIQNWKMSVNLDDFIKEAIIHKAIRDNRRSKEIAQEAQRDVADALNPQLDIVKQILESFSSPSRSAIVESLGSIYPTTLQLTLAETLKKGLGVSSVLSQTMQEEVEQRKKLLENLRQIQARNEQMLRLYSSAFTKKEEN